MPPFSSLQTGLEILQDEKLADRKRLVRGQPHTQGDPASDIKPEWMILFATSSPTRAFPLAQPIVNVSFLTHPCVPRQSLPSDGSPSEVMAGQDLAGFRVQWAPPSALSTSSCCCQAPQSGKAALLPEPSINAFTSPFTNLG